MTRNTGEPSALATRRPVIKCSSAEPHLGLNRTELGQMLHDPRYSESPAAAASAFTSFNATSSREGKQSKSDRNRVSNLSPAAYWISSEAFHPNPRTAKLSIPSAIDP